MLHTMNNGKRLDLFLFSKQVENRQVSRVDLSLNR